jgi:hypothetical protein
MEWIKSVAKAIAGAATAFGAAFATAYTDQAISSGEWVTIVVATIAAFAAVWAIPNS